MSDSIKTLLEGTTGMIDSEKLLMDAARDVVKDQIKAYILEKIEENPDIKQELKEGVEALIEAKIKEGMAMAKIGKATARLGLTAIPENMKEDIAKDFVSIFENEIMGLLEKMG